MAAIGLMPYFPGECWLDESDQHAAWEAAVQAATAGLAAEAKQYKAERDAAQEALAEILQMTWHGDQRLKIQARAARALQAPPKPEEVSSE